jgi:hypothetical protein
MHRGHLWAVPVESDNGCYVNLTLKDPSTAGLDNPAAPFNHADALPFAMPREAFRACEQITFNAQTAEPTEENASGLISVFCIQRRGSSPPV